MASKFLNSNSKQSLNQKFREKRFQFFKGLLDKLGTKDTIRILDIGGTEAYWENMNFVGNQNIHITLLNINQFPVKHANFISVKGDACNLSEYADKQFDLVHSNSVIEHLFTFENQQRMASEAMRVGKSYYIQTPNYYFPIEPHWVFPFFHFLPVSLRVFLTKNFNLGHYKKAESQEAALNRVKEVQLLSEGEMKTLFPNGKVYREKFLGLTKSVTLYHFPNS